MKSIIIYDAKNRPVRPSAQHGPPERLGLSHAARRGLTRRADTGAWQGFLGLLSVLPDPDELLQHEGDDIYERMRADDAVFPAEFQLMSRVLARPWDVRPPEHLAADDFAAEVAAYVKGALESMNTMDMLFHLYTALRSKKAGGQLVYRLEGLTALPAHFYAEPDDLFGFNRLGDLRLCAYGLPEEPEPYRWVVHVNEPTPKRPGGRSIFSRVYYPWTFRRAGWDLWVTALDRFAVPSLAALFELADESQITAQALADMIAEQLLAVSSGSVGALANTKALAQVGGARAVEGFDTFLELCDRAIFRGLLTTTLTVSEGKVGAERGSTAEHDKAADRVAAYYAKQLAESLTRQVCAYAALLKYGEAARRVLPRFEFDFQEAFTFERALKLMEQRFPLSRSAIYSRFGAFEPADEADVFIKGGAASAGGDGASGGDGAAGGSGAMAMLSFPVEDLPEVQRRLATYHRNQAIRSAFSSLRKEGAMWDEALDALHRENKWNLARDTYRNIVGR